MKRKLILFIILFFPYFIAADVFTDAVQDLAVQIACTGTYNATQIGKTWRDDPYDYYTPKYMAERFTKLSGSTTEYGTFYGVCYNYAKYAYNFIRNNKKSFEAKGMLHDQFYIAACENDYNTITLYDLGKPDNYTVVMNGEKLKKFTVKRFTSHERTTVHAWLWIQRNDGQWFWIDPTWTDSRGYVVWGYIDEKTGKEVQLRPKRDYCITYPSSVNNLPLESVVPSRPKLEPVKPVTPNITPLPKPVPAPEPKPTPKPAPKPAPTPNPQPAPKPAPVPVPNPVISADEYWGTYGTLGLISTKKDSSADGFGIEVAIENSCSNLEDGVVSDILCILYTDLLFNGSSYGPDFGMICGTNIGWAIIPFFQPYVGIGIGFGHSQYDDIVFLLKGTIGFRVEMNPFCFKLEASWDSVLKSNYTISFGYILD